MPRTNAYNAAIAADSPCIWWKMEESSGNPQDSSGTGNHITGAAGTRAYQQPGAVGYSISGSAAGTNHFTKTGLTTPPTTALTVAMSIRATGAAASSAILFWYGWTTSGGYLLQETSGGVQFGVMDNAGTPAQVVASSATTIPRDGGFHRLVGTYDGSAPKVYLDGVLRQMGSTSAGITLADNAQSMFVLQPQTGQTIYMDEVVVVPSAWNQTRVTSDFNLVSSGAGLLLLGVG